MLKNPKPGTEFRNVEGHLALFHQAEDPDDYWAKYWASFDFQSLHSSPGFPALGDLGPVFARYLPRGEVVLEAGCGAGRIMAALEAEGFEVIGIERSREVVKTVNERAAHLDVRLGDVERLPFEDNSIGSYVSLGVVEHFEGGPHDALKEAWRVLKPGGWALVSVPYLNPRRARLLRNLRQKAPAEDLSFHQFYFSRERLDERLGEVGLVVRDHLPYAVEAFLVREHPVFSSFWDSVWCREKVKKSLRPRFAAAGSRARWAFAHMLLAMCQKSP